MISPAKGCCGSAPAGSAETALLREAKRIGCRTQPGRPMMDFQTEAMAAFFDIDRKDRTDG